MIRMISPEQLEKLIERDLEKLKPTVKRVGPLKLPVILPEGGDQGDLDHLSPKQTREAIRDIVKTKLPLEDIDEEIRELVIWINMEGYNHLETTCSCAGHPVIPFEAFGDPAPMLQVSGRKKCLEKLNNTAQGRDGVTTSLGKNTLQIEVFLNVWIDIEVDIVSRLVEEGYIESKMVALQNPEKIRSLPGQVERPNRRQKRKLKKHVLRGRKVLRDIFEDFFASHPECSYWG